MNNEYFICMASLRKKKKKKKKKKEIDQRSLLVCPFFLFPLLLNFRGEIVRSWALSIAPSTFVIFIGNIIKNMCTSANVLGIENDEIDEGLRRIFIFVVNLLCKWEGLQAT